MLEQKNSQPTTQCHFKAIDGKIGNIYMRAEYDCLLKVLLIGEFNVGKSAIFERFSGNPFVEKVQFRERDIHHDFAQKTFDIDEKTIKIVLYNNYPNVQLRFQKPCRPNLYRGAHAIVLIYDVTNRESFNELRNLFNGVERYASQNVRVFLVWNKCDVEHREVAQYEGEDFADSLDLFFIETSAQAKEKFESAARSRALADSCYENVIMAIIESKNIKTADENALFSITAQQGYRHPAPTFELPDSGETASLSDIMPAREIRDCIDRYIQEARQQKEDMKRRPKPMP